MSTDTIEAVTLSRGACFGPCPIYEVTLRGDGTALWVGEEFTARRGTFRGTFEPEDFAQLASFVDRCGFFDWAEHYEPELYVVTDGPTTTISATRQRTTKTVSQYVADEPADFWVLAALVDALASQVGWTEVAPRRVTQDRHA